MKKDWKYKKLGEICEVLNGFAFKSADYIENGVRVMRITNVQKGKIVDEDPKYFPISRINEIEKFVLKEGDLLISLTGNVGRVGLVPEKLLPCALNQRVACLRLREQSLLMAFLFHILNSNKFENDCIFNATGIAQKNMSTKWLAEYKIPIPPHFEQETIVSELDLLSSIIDKQKKQLEELNNLAQSIFYDMFGNPVENEKGWKVSCVGDVSTQIHYGTSKPACDKGKYKYIRMGNLTYNGYLDFQDLKTINIPDNEIENCIVRKGDILFNRTNSLDLIGKTCMFDEKEPMVIAGYIIRVRLKDCINTCFFARLFNIPEYKKLLKSMAKGAVNQANINSKELASIKLILPPLTIQQSFADKVKAIEKQKANIKKSIEETQKLFYYTMDKYFG